MKDTYEEQQLSAETSAENTAPNPVEKDRQKQVQQGYGAMAIAASMAGGARDGGKEPRIVTYAKMFLILFAMLLPSLLLIRVVL